MHELGHAVAAWSGGLTVSELSFTSNGVRTVVGMEGRTPQTCLRMALGGPAGTAVAIVLFEVVGLLVLHWSWFEATNGLRAAPEAGVDLVVKVVLGVNLGALCLHLIPAPPFDGGHMLRDVVWRLSGDQRAATRTLSDAGIVIGLILAVVGAYGMAKYRDDFSYWAAAGLGVLILIQADRIRSRLNLYESFADVTVAAAVIAQPPIARADVPARRVWDELFAEFPERDFVPVLDWSGNYVGSALRGPVETAAGLQPDLPLRSLVGSTHLDKPVEQGAAD
jgi:Zn-dependent protease